MLDFTGKCIVVTGASSGIGKATANCLASYNANLVLVARGEEALQAANQELPYPERHTCLVCDLSAEADRFFDLFSAHSNSKVIDGLVHASGIRLLEPLQISAKKSWEETFSLNIIAAMQLVRALKRLNKKHPASIVLISSIAGIVGSPGISAYCASKGAVDAAVRSWALELATSNIRVNAVSPGYVHSKMLEAHKKLISPKAFNDMVDQYPLGIGTPEDVANAVVFLLSSMSRWITGISLVVDGGYCAH